jgi:hypothetical protein
MNFTYLDNAFQQDNRAVLLYPIKDYGEGLFLEIGTTVEVEDIMLDPQMSSGYAVVIHLNNSSRAYFVDKDYVMAYKDFKSLYNKALDMALQKGKL